MTTRQLIGLAERFSLPDVAIERLDVLRRIVQSDPEAPTTIRSEQAVIDDHLADSLVALDLQEIRHARALADIGSGAGFPGLVLAIALAQTSVTLVEANGKKCAYLLRVCERCRLENVRIVHDRAEFAPKHLEPVDTVTARALARLDVVAEYAAPLLALGGHLVAWRGEPAQAEDAAAERAASILGLRFDPPIQVRPYAAARNRFLHLARKEAPTPARFPRRPGVAAKRPLGGILAA